MQILQAMQDEPSEHEVDHQAEILKKKVLNSLTMRFSENYCYTFTVFDGLRPLAAIYVDPMVFILIIS